MRALWVVAIIFNQIHFNRQGGKDTVGHRTDYEVFQSSTEAIAKAKSPLDDFPRLLYSDFDEFDHAEIFKIVASQKYEFTRKEFLRKVNP